MALLMECSISNLTRLHSLRPQQRMCYWLEWISPNSEDRMGFAIGVYFLADFKRRNSGLTLRQDATARYDLEKLADALERSGSQRRRDHSFSATKMHTPDQ